MSANNRTIEMHQITVTAACSIQKILFVLLLPSHGPNATTVIAEAMIVCASTAFRGTFLSSTAASQAGIRRSRPAFGPRATNAGLAGGGGREEGATECGARTDDHGLCDHGRRVRSVARKQQHEQDLLDASGRRHGDLVHLDDLALRRHLPREARISGEVRRGARCTDPGPLR